MKIAMISQPMNGKTADEIINTRNKAIEWLKTNEYRFIDTLFTDKWYKFNCLPKHGVENVPLFQLSKSLEQMSKCDTVYFCKDWENYRGCRIEHEVAKAYGLEIIYEEDK